MVSKQAESHRWLAIVIAGLQLGARTGFILSSLYAVFCLILGVFAATPVEIASLVTSVIILCLFGILPATILGILTGGSIALLNFLAFHFASPMKAGVIGAGTSLVIAAYINFGLMPGLLPTVGYWSWTDYTFGLGIPSLLYVLTGWKIGRILHRRLTDRRDAVVL